MNRKPGDPPPSFLLVLLAGTLLAGSLIALLLAGWAD
jgi:hypothetical protein